MPGFLGSYLHQLDSKGRVSLPVSFRRGCESASFVLIHMQPGALFLYPDFEWADVQANLLDFSRRQPEHRHQVLRITANAVEVMPDKQGRILIPERMRRAVGIGREVQLVGAINKIEIWDPARFETATAVTDDDVFARHMQKVFV